MRQLRNLSVEEVTKLAGDLSHSVDRGGLTRAKNRLPQPDMPAPPKATAEPTVPKPFAHPHYWAAFILIGDAE